MKNIILVTAAAALLLVMVFQSDEPKKEQALSSSAPKGGAAKPIPTAKSLNDQINKHMQDLELKKSFNKMSAELAWEDTYSELPSEVPKEENLPKHIDANVYDPASKVYADLNPDEKGIRTVLPSERIQSKIANRRWVKEYDQEMRREYVYAFVDNMRRDGFDVRLNDQLEVVSVRQLQKPQFNVDQAIEKNLAFSR